MTIDNIKIIYDRQKKIVKNYQKSYMNVRRKDLEFEVGD